MPRRDRSLFREEQDFRSSQLMEELISLVEAFKSGFTIATPFAAIMRTIADFLYLVRDLAREGIKSFSEHSQLIIHEGIEENPDFHESTWKSGQKAWKSEISPTRKRNRVNRFNEKEPDPLFNLRDSNMVVTSTKNRQSNPLVSLTPRLDRWFENMITTCLTLAKDPTADPNFMIGQFLESVGKTKVKLNRENYNYFKRQRASRKSIRKDKPKGLI